MCDCVNIAMGSYDNTKLLKIPKIGHCMSTYIKNRQLVGLSDKGICIDKCLVDEVEYLWSLGIKTNGCCCGHNKIYGYIGVCEEHITQMIVLGYKSISDKYSFTPKTV